MNDKILHLFVSLVLVVVLSLFLHCAAALVVTLAVGVLKELADKYVKRTMFDWYDLVADALGALAGVVVSSLNSYFLILNS